MTNEAQKQKNANIRRAGKATREKRKTQRCRVFEVKVTKGKLSYEKEEHIRRLFLEGKWLWNHTLAGDDVFAADICPKSVTVKTPDGLEERPLIALGSQMKQDIVESVKTAIKGLAAKKAKGEKVGRVRFRKYCDSIPLRQYGVTYRIDFENNTISIQGLKKPIKVRGLGQIPPGADIANAKLVRKPSGLYFHITTYSLPEEKAPTGAAVGIDFGIKANMTFNTGKEVNICVPETKAIKIASRKTNKALVKNGRDKRTGKHRKRVKAQRAAYEKLTNKKRDLANKEVSKILNDNDFVAIQDEMVANWHKGLFGRQVQHSAMGFIKARLKTSPKTHVVPRSFPSTQRCPVPTCGKDTPHPLKKRDYDCAVCGYHHESRDIKSAAMILMEAQKQVCAERTAKSPVEASASFSVRLVRGKRSPMKREAQVL